MDNAGYFFAENRGGEDKEDGDFGTTQ